MAGENLVRRDFLARSAAGVTAALANAGAQGAETSSQRRPNVLWLLGDQHRAQALSCMGDPNLTTPNIDKLAGGIGVTAVAGCPLCTPFRGSLLTSRYPHECTPGHDYAMPDGMPTVAAPFNEAGYHTAYFGKWHVDGRDNRAEGERSGKQFVRPKRRGGFEMWLGYENNNAQYDCWLHGHDVKGDPIELFQIPKYETDGVTDHLIEYIEDRGREQAAGDARPFFAAMSVQPPHSPYVAPEEWTARHRPEDVKLRRNVPPVKQIVDDARRDLAGILRDDRKSRLEHRPDRRDAGRRRDNWTIHISSSSRTTATCMDPTPASSNVCRGRNRFGSRSSYPKAENPAWSARSRHRSTRPSIMSISRRRPSGSAVCPCPSGCAAPTCPDSSTVLGAGKARRSDSAFLQLVDPGFKYGFASDRERPWRGVVTQDGWKYAVLEGQPWLLHDLNEDPYELANHALDGRYKVERRKLQERLAAWMNDTGDTFALPEIT